MASRDKAFKEHNPKKRVANDNKELTEEAVENQVRTMFGGTIAKLHVGRKNLAWAKATFDYDDRVFSGESGVWAVAVEGDLECSLFRDSRNHDSSKPAKGIRAELALSIEDGSVLAATLHTK